MNNTPPDYFKFDGKVRYKSGVSAPTCNYKDGCWILDLDSKTNRWFLIVQTSPQFDNQLHKLCKLSLETLSSVPCTAPSGNTLSLSFQGKCVDIKTDSNVAVKEIYKTIQKLVSSQKNDFKLSSCVQPMLNRHNVVNGRNYSSHSSANSSFSNNDSRKKKLSLEDAQQLILQDSPEKEPRSPVKKVPSPTMPKTPYGDFNRNVVMNVRLRSEAAQNRVQSPIRENGSALSLIDKENAIKTTPQRSASSINLTSNRTPLSDKSTGLSTSRFYKSSTPADFSMNIPGITNNVAKEYELAAPETSGAGTTTTPPKMFTRSVTKRIKPTLDVYNSTATTTSDYSTKRLKRLNNEDDACWKPSTSFSPPAEQTLLGFSNLGNTCYMNSILQSLFALDIFTMELWKTYTRLKHFITDDSLLYSLPQLLKNKDSASRSMKDEFLLRVKNAISASATRFSGYSQHDAHEFLAQVLDQLKEEIKKLCDDNDQKLPNPVANNFEFDVSHVIECQSCSNTVTKSEQFNDLSLDLPSSPDDDDTPISLQKLIDNFFDSEQVTYKCEQCSCDFSLIKHNFVKMPKILILHVKRYNFDSKISKNVKCSKMICIPPTLSLAQHFIGQAGGRSSRCEDETIFRLCGIVTHLGVFSSTGHYVCDVYDMKKDAWRSCDDSRVCDTTELDVCQMRQKDGYIFFYVAKRVLNELRGNHSPIDFSLDGNDHDDDILKFT